ncbi:MAG: thioredoxin family protein [Armatimonadetes bacterium]|nr:thioredoxin family protein [Armatimonadota bacterium]
MKVCVAALLVAGSAVSIAALKSEASPKLKAFADALGAAQSFSATYSVQPIGGSPVEFKVAFAKPDKARIETADSIVVADGKTITTYNKQDNTYFDKPQTELDLLSTFNGVETSVWKPFFKPESVKNYATSKDSGTKSRGGKTLNVVEVSADAKGQTTMRLYTDSTDMLCQGEVTVQSSKGAQTSVMIVTEAAFNAGSDLFAFKAPNGAKKVEFDALTAGVWLSDFDKALQIAKASNKLVMVDFMASWCGPCKMMDAEVFHSEKFKDVAKDFVLVKVDVDLQKDIASRYNITAMPTVKFLRGDGSVVHEFVGYGGPDQVYGEISTAKGKK